MLSEEEVINLVKTTPQLLQQTGKVLNTWRLIMGESCIPVFDIRYAEVLMDGNLIELHNFDDVYGYDNEGSPIDITKVDSIVDLDVTVTFNRANYPHLELCHDVLYHPFEKRYVTLAYLMNNNTTPKIINSLPLFDHTKIRYIFGERIVVGIDNYHKILKPIEFWNCKLTPNQHGMVKIAYDVEVPYTIFYNQQVHEWLNELLPIVPLIHDKLRVQLQK